jgi:phenylacetate-CoA ligase
MTTLFEAYMKEIESTERLPPRALANYQQQLLARLVCHANDRLPFYAERLSCLFTADDKIDLSRWNDVPLLTRDDVIRNGAAMRVANLPTDFGEVTESRTSGSTGVPLQIATNGAVFFAANALLTRAARRFGMDTSRPLAVIGRFGDQPRDPELVKAGWSFKTGWSCADPRASLYEIELMTPINRQIEWLTRWRAPYLHTHPSGALAIAHAVTPAEGRALGLEMILMNGETVPDGAREFIAERLGARAAAIYSCEEIGHIASECEAAPHYHVAAENALVEIVDDRGRDVAPGERGRVVVTGLYNYAMPFIRYAMGDVAVAGTGACPCGRTLPVIARVDGRTRNAFLFRDGTRIWPRTSMVRAMQAYVPFRRFQMVQLNFEKIEFRYIADGSGRRPDVAALNDHARRVIHASVEVSAVEIDALTPGPSGKFEEFISHVPRVADRRQATDRLQTAAGPGP